MKISRVKAMASTGEEFSGTKPIQAL